MHEVRTFADGCAGLKPKDIRLDPEESKVSVYEELERQRLAGIKIGDEEYDDFPSVLIRVNDQPAYLTDVLSIERWWSGHAVAATDDTGAFKHKIEQLLESGETVVVLPLGQIQGMRTNELYLLERSMHYKGKPIEIRSIINIQKELKRRTGMI